MSVGARLIGEGVKIALSCGDFRNVDESKEYEGYFAELGAQVDWTIQEEDIDLMYLPEYVYCTPNSRTEIDTGRVIRRNNILRAASGLLVANAAMRYEHRKSRINSAGEVPNGLTREQRDSIALMRFVGKPVILTGGFPIHHQDSFNNEEMLRADGVELLRERFQGVFLDTRAQAQDVVGRFGKAEYERQEMRDE